MTLRTRLVISPPTMPMAKGRWESEDTGEQPGERHRFLPECGLLTDNSYYQSEATSPACRCVRRLLRTRHDCRHPVRCADRCAGDSEQIPTQRTALRGWFKLRGPVRGGSLRLQRMFTPVANASEVGRGWLRPTGDYSLLWSDRMCYA